MYYDYLFQPKDETLELFFEVVVVTRIESLRKLLEKESVDFLLVYINLEFGAGIFSNKVVADLRRFDGLLIGLYNTDPFSWARSASEALLKELRFDAVIAVDPVCKAYQSLGGYPSFYWPWSVNPTKFKIVEEKKFDLFSSNRNRERSLYYGWRCSVGAEIEKILTNQIVVEGSSWSEYQERLSEAKFAYTCGSVTNTIVNKHLEIPASGVCLITEQTALTDMMGWVDGVNCLYGELDNVEARTLELLNDDSALQSVICKGRQLVIEKHSHGCRTIAFELWKLYNSGCNLGDFSQSSPFEPPIESVGRSSNREKWLGLSPPRDLQHIAAWEGCEYSSGREAVEKLQQLQSKLRGGHPDMQLAAARYFLSILDVKNASKELNVFFRSILISKNYVHLNTDCEDVIRSFEPWSRKFKAVDRLFLSKSNVSSFQSLGEALLSFIRLSFVGVLIGSVSLRDLLLLSKRYGRLLFR